MANTKARTDPVDASRSQEALVAVDVRGQIISAHLVAPPIAGAPVARPVTANDNYSTHRVELPPELGPVSEQLQLLPLMLYYELADGQLRRRATTT